MKILDCESVSSTYNSIQSILGIPEKQLKSVFDEMSSEEIVDFREEFCSKIEPIQYNIDYICWFHITRIKDDVDFSEGILPLNQSIERIWNYLFTLTESFTTTQWNDFKERMNSLNFASKNSHYGTYHNKVSNSLEKGPFSMLVKEIAFNPKQAGYCDFFKIPEIIADICSAFNYEYGYDLADKYVSETKPCIVKFRHREIRDGLLSPALFYLYKKHKVNELCFEGNDVFSNEGQLVPSEDILNIERY